MLAQADLIFDFLVTKSIEQKCWIAFVFFCGIAIFLSVFANKHMSLYCALSLGLFSRCVAG